MMDIDMSDSGAPASDSSPASSLVGLPQGTSEPLSRWLHVLRSHNADYPTFNLYPLEQVDMDCDMSPEQTPVGTPADATAKQVRILQPTSSSSTGRQHR